MASTGKDFWDKLSIVGNVLIAPLLIAAATFLGTDYMEQLEEEARLQEHDIETMSKFHTIYSDERTYRLARYFIPMIKSDETRRALREFVVWDLLERNIRADGRFVFDPELSDWHMLGEVIRFWCGEEPETDYFQVMRNYTMTERWPMHAEQLGLLHTFLTEVYLQEHPSCMP